MSGYLSMLKYDPLPALLASPDPALGCAARRCLLGLDVDVASTTGRLPAVLAILSRQTIDGSWGYHPSRVRAPASNYGLIETWKALRFLIDQYGLRKDHPSLQRAAEYLFTCQSDEGDFRGFLANQYATYYTGALLSLLVNAGYADDERVEIGFRWLLSMRQHDGGWSVPIMTHQLTMAEKDRLTRTEVDPVMPDRTKPFSHNANGMILRAFAAHPAHRLSEAAARACSLQKTRFFLKDCYTSYQSAGYWLQFRFPFWWNNLVASLDSISLIDTTIDAPVENAIQWLVDHQRRDAMWDISYTEEPPRMSERADAMRMWVTFAICRLLRRFCGE